MTKTSVFSRAESDIHVGINGTQQILMGLVLAVAVMFPHPDATAGQAAVELGSASRFAVKWSGRSLRRMMEGLWP